MFKEGEEKNIQNAIANLVDAVDMTNFSEEFDIIRSAMEREGNPANTDTAWKDKYDTLYGEYVKRFKQTFGEPIMDPKKLDPDVSNTDTVFTEKDILRFDFSGKNE